MSIPHDLLRFGDVRDQYGIPVGTLHHWKRNRLLCTFRLGRHRYVRRRDLEELIENAIAAERADNSKRSVST